MTRLGACGERRERLWLTGWITISTRYDVVRGVKKAWLSVFQKKEELRGAVFVLVSEEVRTLGIYKA